MKISNVLNCSFSYWYSQFRRQTIESRVIPLTQQLIDYLLQDGIYLPSGSYKKPEFDRNSDEEDEDADHWDDSDTEEVKLPSFPEFENQIKNSIEELGGRVFPKLNWSSPKDAKWISCDHTLQCATVGEVLLLLKSSDFITHDLTEPFKDCDDWSEKPDNDSSVETPVAYELILRKWTDINPATEFRCFVKGAALIAISQRDYTNFYDYIPKDKDKIVKKIKNYYDNNICNKFTDVDYCFDIYFPSLDTIKIVDFNPFGETTDALLFEWDYLFKRKPKEGVDPEFRCVMTYDGIQPSPYRYYAVPVDILHLSTGQDPYKMTDFLQLMRNGTLDVNIAGQNSDEVE
ncbi:hypothetical protein CHUAL_005345 [Chamberlinius hualienensis]